MTSGSMILNGVTDKQLAKIIEYKASHEGLFNFSLSQTQQVPTPPNQPTTYNNFVILWGSDNGLKAVVELLASLIA
ncbi:MAG: hypothetical protein WA789_01015 [Candidatus Acidiferrum sp.]